MFEDENNQRKRFDDIKNLPIYVKAEELHNLITYIVETVKNTDFEGDEVSMNFIGAHIGCISKNSLIIPGAIAEAEYTNMYDLKMENAAVIRRAAHQLIVHVNGIQMKGFKDVEYLDLVRNAVEEFRVIFAEWVKKFDPWDYKLDRWGLFNPPGINYDDLDDENDPFDPSILGFFDDDEFGADDEDDLDHEGFDGDFDDDEDADEDDESDDDDSSS